MIVVQASRLQFLGQAGRLHYKGFAGNDVEFVDPRSSPFVPPKSRGELPHLYKPAGTYFVTFRLSDAVLSSKGSPTYDDQGAIKPHAAANDSPEDIVGSYDPPITLGACVLRKPEIARVVQNALLHFEGKRYSLLAWCIMPNHVHVLFSPLPGNAPPGILHSWKSFTSHEINRIQFTSGSVWERESFDHLVRNIESLERFAEYVDKNPVNAGLCARPEDWTFGSAGFRFNCGAGVPPAH